MSLMADRNIRKSKSGGTSKAADNKKKNIPIGKKENAGGK